MKKLFQFIFIVVIASLATACGTDGCGGGGKGTDDVRKEDVVPENLIVLLDLSDRILNPSQIQADSVLIAALFERFVAIAKKDLFINSKTSFKVMIAPQKNMPGEINLIASTLILDLEPMATHQRRKAIFSYEAHLKKSISEIYKLAHVSDNPSDYQGADVWRSFNDDLTPLLKPNGNNLLFIVTDGYLAFESQKNNSLKAGNRNTSCDFLNTLRKQGQNWETEFMQGDYGLISLNKDFSPLKVMVLEMAPKADFDFEFDLLKKVWRKWFSEMGITETQTAFFKTQTSISTIEPELNRLIALKRDTSQNIEKGLGVSTIPEIKTEENPAQTLSSKGQEKKTEKQTTSQKQVDSLFQVGVNDIYKTKFEFQRLVASSGNAERLSSLFNKMEEQLLKLKKLATNEEDVDFVQKKSKDCEDLKQAFMRYLKREIDNLTSQINRIQESKVGEPSQQPLEDMISQKKKYDEILASVQKN